MDSPRSEFQTRYSTPAPELDDHRFQPSSLLRTGTIPDINLDEPDQLEAADGIYAANESSSVLSDLSLVNEELERNGFVARDFEQAIDNDASDLDNIGRLNPGTAAEPRPTITRQQTLRVGHHGRPKAFTRSESSSRSSSPPNSVDAFADPRRRERANTINSKAPSEYDLCLNRTASNVSHRRRPTFSEGNPILQQGLDADRHASDCEDDVCYPPPEEKTNTYTIDFEALEEFVAEKARGLAPGRGVSHEYSLSSQGQTRMIFADLRPKGYGQGGLNSDICSITKVASDCAIDVEDSGADEKLGLGLHRTASRNRGSLMEPNRFTFFSSVIDTSIHTADLGDLVMPGESFRDLFDLPIDDGVWWLDLLNPDHDEIHAVCKAFKVHPLTMEDIKTQELREKVELFKRYYFVCFRSFNQADKTSDEYLEPLMMYLVVFRQGILSFSFRQNPHAANVRKRIGKLRDTTALGSDWICYALIDAIVDGFGPVITDIERETDVIDDNVFTARADDRSTLLRQIGLCRKKVMAVMRLLGGKADVIKGFAKRCNEQYEMTPRSDIGLYLGDVQDHVVTMMSNLGHFEKMLSRSHSNYLAQIQVDSIHTGNRANEVLSKITLIATILVPLNLICGLFGMNVKVPGREVQNLNWFFGILGLIIAIIVGCLVVFRRLKLI